MKLKVKRIRKDLPPIQRISGEEVSACIDVYLQEDYTFKMGESILVKTNIVVQPEVGNHIKLYLKSSTPPKHGLRLANSVGVIDRKYSGTEEGKEDILMLYLDKPYTRKCLFHLFKNVNEINRGTLTEEKFAEMHKDFDVTLKAGTYIGQFEITNTMTDVEIEEVEEIQKESRGGFGAQTEKFLEEKNKTTSKTTKETKKTSGGVE